VKREQFIMGNFFNPGIVANIPDDKANNLTAGIMF